MDLDPRACYRALCTRDARFDGRLFVGVRTTGIYCRPVCPARTPKREHVQFFPTAAAAHEAGFRPCLRCRPETAPDIAAWRGTSNTVARALDWDDHLPRMVRLLQRQYSSPHIALDRYAERRRPSAARKALELYFGGDIAAIDNVDVEAGGTAFQRTVWAALRRIPAGQTTSYGALASTIERPRAMRAVGLANGSNPIGIIVPCHRVIGASGALTGYGGGLARKQWLLEHEGAIGR